MKYRKSRSKGIKPRVPDWAVTGQRWGMLVATSRVDKLKWLFKCDCGNEKELQISQVRIGKINSCGCKPPTLSKRAYQISWFFKLDIDTAIEIAKRTEGLCDVCQLPETNKDRTGKTRFLNVDHCHATGKIRGVLCSVCNMAIGNANDDPKRLRKLADYLEQE